MECVRSLFTCAYEHTHAHLHTHTCTHTHTRTHTHTAECICCCLGGMEQQGDLRRGEQLCFGSDVPFGCGSSHWRQHPERAPVSAALMCFTCSLDWRCWVMVLPVRLKDKSVDILYSSYCPQISWKDQNQLILLTSIVCVASCILILCAIDLHCCPELLKHIKGPHCYHEHHQTCISTQLKVVPYKCTIYSLLSNVAKNYSAQLFYWIISPILNMKLYNWDQFLKIYVFSSNK